MKRILKIAVCALLVASLSIVAYAAKDYYAPLGAEYTQTVDTAFTFAVVGDTQVITNCAYSKLNTLYQFILDRKESDNIQFVAGMGDITDMDLDWEWKGAVKHIKKLDGQIPYSLVRGNHDSKEQFLKYIGYDTYTSLIDGMYENILNTYQTVEIGTLKYLFLNLDHGPSDEVLAWACDVVEDHPDYNIIVTTHGYINAKGELLQQGTSTVYPSITSGVNDAPAIWNQLVRKYENIVMVLCGHISGAEELVSYEVTGDHGNKIQQVLIDPQKADLTAHKDGNEMMGMVALFHFSADGKQVQVENYSTLRKQHYGSGLTLTLNSVGGNADATFRPEGSCSVPAAPGETGENIYESFNAALADFTATGSNFIRLEADMPQDISVTKDVYLDLNGFDITGNISIADGCTLYCMDTVTDAYTNEDYGKLTGTVTGDLQAVAVGSGVSAVEQRQVDDPTPYRAGYLKITENNEISFHRVDLDLTSVSFSPNKVGISYTCPFSGDAVVARNVKQFGVALSLGEEPTAENMGIKSVYSWFKNFSAGKESNTSSSTRLINILRDDFSLDTNINTANRTVYGKAYLQTADGYFMGTLQTASLRWAVEQASKQLENAPDTLVESAVELYKAYADVMEGWDIPELLDAVNGNLKKEPLKVLVLGNAHTLDATKLLYKVFEAEAPRTDLVLGVLYHDSCTIENHYLYATNGTTKYNYYKMDRHSDVWQTSGSESYDYTLAQGLQDEDWDVVLLQQMNTWAGVPDHFRYTYINKIISAINNTMDEDPLIAWHMGWTNPDQPEYLTANNGISGMTTSQAKTWATRYAWYETDQDVMYERMVSILNHYILTNSKISYVIPNGTAIEYAQNVLNNTQAEIYRNRTNLTDYAALMSAYTWYAKLMDLTALDEIKLTSVPAALSLSGETTTFSAQQIADIKTAVNYALANPYSVPTTEENARRDEAEDYVRQHLGDNLDDATLLRNAWQQVGATVSGTTCKDMTAANGFLPVGSYTAAESYTETTTLDVVTNNGAATMAAAYAKLHHGDALLQVSDTGEQVLMVADVLLSFNSDGTVNTSVSFVTVVGQDSDTVYKLDDLLSGGYLPITCDAIS